MLAETETAVVYGPPPPPTELSIDGMIFLGVLGCLGLGVLYGIFCIIRYQWRESALRINSKNAQSTLDRFAGCWGKEKLVRKAVACGAVVDSSHLIAAASYGLASMFKELFRLGVNLDINAVVEGETAISVAMRTTHRYSDITVTLLEYGATVSPRDYYYALANSRRYVNNLLEDGLVSPNYFGPSSLTTPLYEALLRSEQWVVETLLHHGADIEPALDLFQKSFASSGSLKARKAIRYLREIQRARGALNPTEPKTVWDHLGEED